MKKIVILTFIIMFGISCGKKPIENPEQYFGIAETEDIGVLREMPWGSKNMWWEDDFMEFFSEPDEKTRFATVKVNDKGVPKFDPTNFEDFFNPFSIQSILFTFRVLEYDSLWIKIIVDENTLRTCYIKNTILYPDKIDGFKKHYTFETKFRTWGNYFRGKPEKDTIINGKEFSIYEPIPLVKIKENPTLYRDTIYRDIISLNEKYKIFAIEPIEIQGEWMHGYILGLEENTEREYGGYTEYSDRIDWTYWTYILVNEKLGNWAECWIKWRDGNRMLITTDEMPRIWDKGIRI